MCGDEVVYGGNPSLPALCDENALLVTKDGALYYKNALSQWALFCPSCPPNGNTPNGSYVLPIASPTILGGIKVGPNLVIDENGILSVHLTDQDFTNFVLKPATQETLGGIKVGRNLTISQDGTLTSIDTNDHIGNSDLILLSNRYLHGDNHSLEFNNLLSLLLTTDEVSLKLSREELLITLSTPSSNLTLSPSIFNVSFSPPTPLSNPPTPLTTPSPLLTLSNEGKLTLPAYGDGMFLTDASAVTYLLGFDANGNVVETDKSTGDGGSGTGSMPEVLDIPSLLLYDRQGGTTVFVKEKKRGGMFNWIATGTSNNVTYFTALGGGFWERQYQGPLHSDWADCKGDGITDDRQAFVRLFAALPITTTSDLNYPEGKGATLVIDPGVYLLKRVSSTQSALITINTRNVTVFAYGATFKMDKLAGCNTFLFQKTDATKMTGSFRWYGGIFDGNRRYQTSKVDSVDPENLLTDPEIAAAPTPHDKDSIGNVGLLTAFGYYDILFESITVTGQVNEGLVARDAKRVTFRHIVGRDGLPISYNNTLNGAMDGSDQHAYIKVRNPSPDPSATPPLVTPNRVVIENVYTEYGSIGIHLSSDISDAQYTAELHDIRILNPMQDAIHIEHCRRVNMSNIILRGEAGPSTSPRPGLQYYRPKVHIGSEATYIHIQDIYMMNAHIECMAGFQGLAAKMSRFQITNTVPFSYANLANFRDVNTGVFSGNYVGEGGANYVYSCDTVQDVKFYGPTPRGGAGARGVGTVKGCYFSNFDTPALIVQNGTVPCLFQDNIVVSCNYGVKHNSGTDGPMAVERNVFYNIKFYPIQAGGAVTNLYVRSNIFTDVNTNWTTTIENDASIVNQSINGYLSFTDNRVTKEGTSCSPLILSSRDSTLKGVEVRDNEAVGLALVYQINNQAAGGYNNFYDRGNTKYNKPEKLYKKMANSRLSTSRWLDYSGNFRLKTVTDFENVELAFLSSAPANDTDGVLMCPVVGSSTSPPTSGRYVFGSIINNLNASTANNASWMQVTPGDEVCTLQWTPSTSYWLPDWTVYNGPNVYAVTTAGTSASSGGPSGTGTDIVDGAVHWRWLGTLSPIVSVTPWTPSTNFTSLGILVYNSGNVYKLTKGGVSAASGGPTSTLSGKIVDGAAEWQYIGPRAVFKEYGLLNTTPGYIGGKDGGAVSGVSYKNLTAGQTAPLPSDLQDGYYQVFQDTTNNVFKLYVNDGGTIREVGGGGGASVTIGTIDSRPPSPDSLTMESGILYAQYATNTSPGMLSTLSQTIGGAKTFNETVTVVKATGTGRDYIMRAYMSDALSSNDQFFIANATHLAGQFNPCFGGYIGGSDNGIAFRSLTSPAFSTSGVQPMISMACVVTNNPADPQNPTGGLFSSVVNKPLFDITNSSQLCLRVAANGDVSLPLYGAGTKPGTVSRFLAVDGSGKLIEATPGISAFQVLDPSPTVDWNTLTKGYNTTLAIAHNCTLVPSGDVNGSEGNCVITQPSTGSTFYKVTVPSGDRVARGAAVAGSPDTIDLPEANSAVCMVSYIKTSTYRIWNKQEYL